MTLGILVGAIVFGALHYAAWNLHFPTPVEHLLWKITAVFTTIAPLVWFALGRTIRELGRDSAKQNSKSAHIFIKIFDTMMAVLLVPYIIARLYIMVELFRSLLFLEPKTFASTWSSNIPHLN
jgi:hypothetical protein